MDFKWGYALANRKYCCTSPFSYNQRSAVSCLTAISKISFKVNKILFLSSAEVKRNLALSIHIAEFSVADFNFIITV